MERKGVRDLITCNDVMYGRYMGEWCMTKYLNNVLCSILFKDRRLEYLIHSINTSCHLVDLNSKADQCKVRNPKQLGQHPVCPSSVYLALLHVMRLPRHFLFLFAWWKQLKTGVSVSSLSTLSLRIRTSLLMFNRWGCKPYLCNNFLANGYVWRQCDALLLVLGLDCQVKTVSTIQIFSSGICSFFK